MKNTKKPKKASHSWGEKDEKTYVRKCTKCGLYTQVELSRTGKNFKHFLISRDGVSWEKSKVTPWCGGK